MSQEKQRVRYHFQRCVIIKGMVKCKKLFKSSIKWSIKNVHCSMVMLNSTAFNCIHGECWFSCTSSSFWWFYFSFTHQIFHTTISKLYENVKIEELYSPAFIIKCCLCAQPGSCSDRNFLKTFTMQWLMSFNNKLWSLHLKCIL